MNSCLIAPSILTADFGQLHEQIQAADAGGADLWHLDVMDGHFVPPLSFSGEVIKAVSEATRNLVEVHAMVAHPSEHFETFIQNGASRVIFHYEAAMKAPDLGGPGLGETVMLLRDMGAEVGIALNPETQVDEISDLLPEIQQVTIMLIRPGWGGQQMNTNLLAKVREIRELITKQSLNLHVEVDGGVKPHNASSCREAGADIIVAGSSVFNSDGTPQQSLKILRHSLG